MSTTFAELTLTAEEQELLIEMAWADAMEEAYDRDWTEALAEDGPRMLRKAANDLAWTVGEDYRKVVNDARNAVAAAEYTYMLGREQVKIACIAAGLDPMRYENCLFNPPQKGKRKK